MTPYNVRTSLILLLLVGISFVAIMLFMAYMFTNNQAQYYDKVLKKCQSLSYSNFYFPKSGNKEDCNGYYYNDPNDLMMRNICCYNPSTSITNNTQPNCESECKKRGNYLGSNGSCPTCPSCLNINVSTIPEGCCCSPII